VLLCQDDKDRGNQDAARVLARAATIVSWGKSR
jgi:hypothetical protein